MVGCVCVCMFMDVCMYAIEKVSVVNSRFILSSSRHDLDWGHTDKEDSYSGYVIYE